jgi:hypothetical protein
MLALSLGLQDQFHMPPLVPLFDVLYFKALKSSEYGWNIDVGLSAHVAFPRLSLML